MVFNANYRLMQVKSIAECSSAILSTFIKLPFVINIFVLSNFEWSLTTGFTVYVSIFISWVISIAPACYHKLEEVILTSYMSIKVY